PTCNSCHRMIDPIGLALDNFDVTGRWRIRERGAPIDTKTEFYDGTPMESLPDLLDALMVRRESLLRNFTQHLMAYGVGRRLEYYATPTVRRIVRDAASADYALSAFIWGLVSSDAVGSRTIIATEDQANQGR